MAKFRVYSRKVDEIGTFDRYYKGQYDGVGTADEACQGYDAKVARDFGGQYISVAAIDYDTAMVLEKQFYDAGKVFYNNAEAMVKHILGTRTWPPLTWKDRQAPKTCSTANPADGKSEIAQLWFRDADKARVAAAAWESTMVACRGGGISLKG